MLVSEKLARHGYASTFVTCAQSCLECLQSEHIDVVITDVQMPGMSGLELCEQLREHHPGCVTIVLTSMSAPGLALDAARAGAFELARKPARMDVLEAAIERALEHGRA